MDSAVFVKDKGEFPNFIGISIDGSRLDTVYSKWIPGWVSANFRRDEFTFSSFEAENRVRIAVPTCMQRLTNPAVGLVKNRGTNFVGKERVYLSLASPVLNSFKPKGSQNGLLESRRTSAPSQAGARSP